MISDATVDRYYYIFDSRDRRAVVLDRLTGEEVEWWSVPRVQLIEHVGSNRGVSVLRRFALWCAEQTGIDEGRRSGAARKLWHAAQQSDDAARREVRAETLDAVVRAAALGLPQGQSEAAQLLAIHACTHPDATRAAIDAAHMGERWAEFSAESDPVAAVRRIRQRHVDWLLDAT